MKRHPARFAPLAQLLCCAALAVCAAVGTAVSIACGGGDSTASLAFDPATADALAHGALLVAEDLPDDGWEASREDSFTDSDEPPAETEACRSLAEAQARARKTTTEHRSGRAQRELSRTTDGVFPIAVDLQVNIFNANDPVKDALDVARGYLTGETFRQCFADLIGLNSAEGIEIAAKDAVPSQAVPGDGVARAIEVVITGDGESLEIRLESYIWRHGNAGITVNISGEKPNVTAELVRAALEKTEQRLAELERK